jgi:polyisoprenoid-binding protein YceI
MNRCLFTASLSALLLTGASALAQTSTWTLDTNHTQVDFQIRRVPVSNLRGSFSGITGTVDWDEKDPCKSRVEVTIPTTSISPMRCGMRTLSRLTSSTSRSIRP